MPELPRGSLRDLFTIPNLFTIARLFAAPVIIGMILTRQDRLAAVLFFAAAATDAFDGFVARSFGQATQIGQYIDPIADKVLLSGVYLAFGISGALPVWLVVAIFGRDLYLLVGSFVMLRFTAYRRLQPSWLGKISTMVQVALASAVVLKNTGIDLPPSRLSELVIIATIFTFASGIQYSFRAFRTIQTIDEAPAGE